jgi:quercetin dioxygenase-like cupin family protein
MSPAMGSTLTGCQIIYHKPGECFTVHSHPISEAVLEVFRGEGEAFVENSWYEVREGDVIYVPENVRIGTRNPSTRSKDFICYYWQVPYLSDFNNIFGAQDHVFENQEGPVVPYDTRANVDIQIPMSGFIGNINRGALFTGYGAEMKFIVWPRMGSRKVSLHRAIHTPGFEFKVHHHPDSEDTVLAFRGSGQGFLVDHWYDMEEGDVMYAPSPIKHGSGNLSSNKDPFICTGAGVPPQLDLYCLAEYL